MVEVTIAVLEVDEDGAVKPSSSHVHSPPRWTHPFRRKVGFRRFAILLLVDGKGATTLQHAEVSMHIIVIGGLDDEIGVVVMTRRCRERPRCFRTTDD